MKPQLFNTGLKSTQRLVSKMSDKYRKDRNSGMKFKLTEDYQEEDDELSDNGIEHYDL